jgi:hypothetical protein
LYYCVVNMLMNRLVKKAAFFIVLLSLSFYVTAFTGTIRFSNDFYAAQKYFYNEAKSKFPKITAEKIYPEIPIKGNATNDELKNIQPLSDFFEARRKFLAEVTIYPEQIYPEIFTFLANHPGLSIAASNKAKFTALEKYFYPFFYVFSFDKHYSFSEDIKINPCPLVFCLKDEKKNSLSFNITNISKKNYEFNVSENPAVGYLTVISKRPFVLKGGSSNVVKFNVDVQKLKKDSTFKVFNLVIADPAEPKVKLIVPVVLLPSKDFLNLPPHFFDFNFSYSTFFKHISLQKEKSSWPEHCPNGDCSGKKHYSMRSPERITNSYNFGDLCTIQYYVATSSPPLFNFKNNSFRFSYNELGNIEGADRNCLGNQPGSEVHCPAETPNNGKELYGSRKIEFKLFLPPGKTYDLTMNISYSDLINLVGGNDVSWLQEKKLLVTITDQSEKQVFKDFVNKSQVSLQQKGLTPGVYTIAVFPTTPDGKHTPSFNLQHLNNGNRGRFDFILNCGFSLLSVSALTKK